MNEVEGVLGGYSKSFMGKGEEEIADRALSVSNYFYCLKSPFFVQSGLLGSCKKLFSSHSSPRDLSRSLSGCRAKACCIQVRSIQRGCDQQGSLTPTPTAASVPPTVFLLTGVFISFSYCSFIYLLPSFTAPWVRED